MNRPLRNVIVRVAIKASEGERKTTCPMGLITKDRIWGAKLYTAIEQSVNAARHLIR